jgi:hypothetical protein
VSIYLGVLSEVTLWCRWHKHCVTNKVVLCNITEIHKFLKMSRCSVLQNVKSVKSYQTSVCFHVSWTFLRPKYFEPDLKINCLCIQHEVLCGRGSIAPPILNLCTRRKWAVNFTLRPVFSGERVSVPFKQGVDWASDPVWMLWTRETSVLLAANRTTISRLPSAHPSHYIDSAIPALPSHLDIAREPQGVIW